MKYLNWLFILMPIFVGCVPSENATPTALPTNTAVPTQAFTPTTAPFSEEINDSKGVAMRFIPAGEFAMGSDEANHPDNRDEQPAHQVYLDAFI